MNIPSLPTDSIYKFTCIFGLSIVLFSTYFFWNQINNFRVLEYESKKEATILAIEQKKLEKELKDKAERKDELDILREFLTEGIRAKDSNMTQYGLWIYEKVFELAQNTNKFEEEIEKKKALREIEVEHMSELKKRIRLITIMFVISYTIGAGLFLGGLHLWNKEEKEQKRTTQ